MTAGCTACWSAAPATANWPSTAAGPRARRWSIEEAFQAAKTHIGLDHYQCRSWIAWHRFILLAMFALAILVITVACQQPGHVGPRRDILIALTIAETPLAGRDGYYIYVHERSATGTGALAEAAVRVENAVIVVRFTGADLRTDRSKPVGLQLATRPVDERRLRPTVLALLPAAINHLTENGGR